MNKRKPTKQDYVEATLRRLEQSQEERACVYQVLIDNMPIIVLPGVFPTGDYFKEAEFFAKNLPVEPGGDFLDMGSGTGVLGVAAMHKGARSVLGVDNSEAAVENTAINYSFHERRPEVMGTLAYCLSFSSDVFSGFRGMGKQFDTMFWNIPFTFDIPFSFDMPDGRSWTEFTDLERTVFDPRYEVAKRYFEGMNGFLRNHGRAYVGFSREVGRLDELKRVARDAGKGLVSVVRSDAVEYENSGGPITYEIFEVVGR